MPHAQLGKLEVWYETFGDPDDVPLLLVSGLGSQCLSYEEELCRGFVDRGFFVVRFDNRDVGWSTKLDEYPVDPQSLLSLGAMGQVTAPYTLSDMAGDAVGLLDVLGLPEVHLLGCSMGGMIAQTMAIEHPERVTSLVSVMSTTGEFGVGQPEPNVLSALLEPVPPEREANIERGVSLTRMFGSPEHFDEDRVRKMAAAAFDRCFHPDGTVRQLLAIVVSGSRADGLAALSVPTLVMHGDVDPLIPLMGGERTAELVPGAELVVIQGMGHDLPPPLWSRIIEAVTQHAASIGEE